MIDRDSWQPLVNVVVTLRARDGAALVTRTDREGQHVFEGVAAGHYSIVAEQEGFASRAFGQPESGVSGDQIVAIGRGETREKPCHPPERPPVPRLSPR